jgi:hypothetical protein
VDNIYINSDKNRINNLVRYNHKFRLWEERNTNQKEIEGIIVTEVKTNKLLGFSPQENYTDPGTAACRRS